MSRSKKSKIDNRTRCAAFLAAFMFLVGCAESMQPTEPGESGPSDEELLSQEAEIGETNEPGGDKSDDFYHHGEQDYSEQCKPIPDVPPLEKPMIIISLDGLSLHLYDRAGDYDRVFKIGVGRIGNDGESLTPTSTDDENGLFYVRADKPAVEDASNSSNRRWAWNYSCRIWSGKRYYNPASGHNEYRSYFAGLPFLRFEGPQPAAYGMHGPISNYWRESGGTLRRGYVSGGCIRMENQAITEIFARIQGHRVPVRLQKKVERRDDGLPVNPDRFMNARCNTDADCADPGAICVDDPQGGGKFCTKPCESTSECPARDPGVVGKDPSRRSACVKADLGATDAAGYCMTVADEAANNGCQRFGRRFDAASLPLAESGHDHATVCAPTGDGWFGDACSSDLDCATGQCVDAGDGPGFCSMPCSEYCPDRDGEPLSRCALAIDGRSGGSCVPTCDNDQDCGDQQRCVTREFSGRSGSDKVCVPVG